MNQTNLVNMISEGVKSALELTPNNQQDSGRLYEENRNLKNKLDEMKTMMEQLHSNQQQALQVTNNHQNHHNNHQNHHNNHQNHHNNQHHNQLQNNWQNNLYKT